MSSITRSELSSLYATRTQAEVAEVLGIDQTTVSDKLRRFGIVARARRTPAPKGIVARTLTRRGRTTNRSARQMFTLMYSTQRKGFVTMSRELGVSVGSLHNFAVTHGIPTRQSGRRLS